ncbi:ABC transporter ATP-binding protein [Marinitoga sp. 1154]|uniref:ABC transporter transmembrane domain-containing protein n=1 Tax=Marinitoga sp. 1154 TaxID=1643335 RepID=UPI0015865D16|nr:ABC transporter ATP-binding protein [Marinitoga sp. 1154]
MGNIRFLYKYTKGHRGRLTISMTMMIILSYVSIMPAKYYKEAMDNGILAGDYEYLKKVCMILIGIYVLKSILNYITSKIFIISSQSIIFEIKKNLLKRVLKLPMTFFEGKETGYIMARVGETDKLQILFSQQTFKILISIIEFIIVLYILMKYNIKLTLIALAIMPLYYIVTGKFMGNISKISMELMEKGAKMNGKLEESISGIEEVKNLNIEEKESKKNIDYNKEFVKTAIKQGVLYSIGMELLTLISAIAGIIVLLYAGKDIIFSGFTVGGYIAFANYIGKLYAPVIQLGTGLTPEN